MQADNSRKLNPVKTEGKGFNLSDTEAGAFIKKSRRKISNLLENTEFLNNKVFWKYKSQEENVNLIFSL